MLRNLLPPGYRRKGPPRRSKLDPYRRVIDRILEQDRGHGKKQRHTAKRIYERLRTQYGFGGKYTIVKDYVREHRRRTREMYVPGPILPATRRATSARRVPKSAVWSRPSTTSCWSLRTATAAS